MKVLYSVSLSSSGSEVIDEIVLRGGDADSR